MIMIISVHKDYFTLANGPNTDKMPPQVGVDILRRLNFPHRSMQYLCHNKLINVLGCLSGPPGFTCWILFLWYAVLFPVESLSLLYLLFIS